MVLRRREPPPDPFERAARRVDPQYAQLAEAAEMPRSMRATRLLALFLGLVLVTLAVKRGGDGGTTLEPSCTTAAFALGRTEVLKGGAIAWQAVGPADARVELALDSPHQPPAGLLVPATALTSCRARGRFVLDAAAGEHQVTAYLVSAEGRATVIATKTVTIS